MTTQQEVQKGFAAAFAHVIGVEGGYSNHPNDPGGETMYGVTARIARQFGYLGPMRDLPLETARSIYRRSYWDPLRLDEIDQISPRVALELFDTNVNFYHGAAASFLQRSLRALGQDVTMDGSVGPRTIAALRAYFRQRGSAGELVLLRMLNGLQLADYVRQVEANPGKRSFLFGWVRARVVI